MGFLKIYGNKIAVFCNRKQVKSSRSAPWQPSSCLYLPAVDPKSGHSSSKSVRCDSVWCHKTPIYIDGARGGYFSPSTRVVVVARVTLIEYCIEPQQPYNRQHQPLSKCCKCAVLRLNSFSIDVELECETHRDNSPLFPFIVILLLCAHAVRQSQQRTMTRRVNEHLTLFRMS